MPALGVAIAVVMIVLSAGQTGDTRHVTGTSLTGGQSARIALVCAFTGIFLLVRRARR